MASSASKVADIFTAAGEAFSRLGDLTMQLHPLGEGSSTPGNNDKWSEKEIDMLKSAVTKFGDDLKDISEHVKNKSVSQMKSAIKKRSHQEDGSNSAKKKNPSAKTPNQGEPKPKKPKVQEIKDSPVPKEVPLNPQVYPPSSSVMLSDSALKNIDIDVMFNNSEQEPVFPDIQSGLDPLERQIASEILSEM